MSSTAHCELLRVGNFLHHHFDRAAGDARAGKQVDAIGNRGDARHRGSAGMTRIMRAR